MNPPGDKNQAHPGTLAWQRQRSVAWYRAAAGIRASPSGVPTCTSPASTAPIWTQTRHSKPPAGEGADADHRAAMLIAGFGGIDMGARQGGSGASRARYMRRLTLPRYCVRATISWPGIAAFAEAHAADGRQFHVQHLRHEGLLRRRDDARLAGGDFQPLPGGQTRPAAVAASAASLNRPRPASSQQPARVIEPDRLPRHRLRDGCSAAVCAAD